MHGDRCVQMFVQLYVGCATILLNFTNTCTQSLQFDSLPYTRSSMVLNMEINLFNIRMCTDSHCIILFRLDTTFAIFSDVGHWTRLLNF